MPTTKPIIAIQRVLDSVWTIAFAPISDCEAEILAFTRTHHAHDDDLSELPIFNVVEGEGRIATKIQCRDLLECVEYKVANPQFIFSYSETIPTEIHSPYETLDLDTDLQLLCKIEASGAFLTKPLPKELFNSATNERTEFIQKHLCLTLGNSSPSDVLERVNNVACSMQKFIQTSILDKQPNYAVIWHYEGGSPILFTCRAESEDEAEALLYGYLIDHESNHVEFHIDSIGQLEL
ncbi:hypothetical protein [Vibrio sp. R78045]|uniref:hypothetical protein n=1 Tax=Vibrio sp. R78045 TaxID=3093868 RepID=UPI0036F421FA